MAIEPLSRHTPSLTARRCLLLHQTARHSVATPADWKQGEDVIIAPAVSDEDAKESFPARFVAKKRYLRVTPQP